MKTGNGPLTHSLNPLLVPKFSKERRAIVPLASSFVSIHVRVRFVSETEENPMLQTRECEGQPNTTWEEATMPMFLTTS